MTLLFKKLNFKEQSAVLAWYAPKSFHEELKSLSQFTKVFRTPGKLREIEFALIFVYKKVEIDDSITAIYPKLKDDAIVWFCYPKASSKVYAADFNRDNGWDGLAAYDMEPVRQVSIDENWSALRFRKVEYIKTLNRSKNMIISDAGMKKRTNKN